MHIPREQFDVFVFFPYTTISSISTKSRYLVIFAIFRARYRGMNSQFVTHLLQYISFYQRFFVSTSYLRKFIWGISCTIIFFSCVEIGLRIAGVAEGQSYAPPKLTQIVKEGKIEGEFVQVSVPFFQKKGNMVQTHPQYANGNGQGFPASGAMRSVQFSVEPDPNIPRFFLLGGSAALGQHPVDIKIPVVWNTIKLGQGVSALPEELSISGQIRSLLAKQGTTSEVINVGMIAQDSGGVRRIALEVLEYKPTGLLIYLGNNEGIGMAYGMQGQELPWVPEVRDVFRVSRLYRVISDRVVPARQRFSSPPPPLQGTQPVVLGQLTQTQWRAADEALMSNGQPTDSVYLALQKRLEENLRIIVETATSKGVEVYIIVTPPHLGYPPFFDANSPDLIESNIQEYTSLIGSAKNLEKQKDFLGMEHTLQQALHIESHNATGWFLLGSSLIGQQQHEEAWEAREKSLVLDISRKRSLPIYNDVVANLCMELPCHTQNVYSMLHDKVLSDGFDTYKKLYGDHEHLNPEGCTWIATQFVDLLQQK